MTTFIIGHQKPDLDSVVSALAVAEFRHLRGETSAVAVMTDSANPETVFVFDKFKLTLPQVISADDITPEDKIVLVDHNEESQRLVGLNSDQIVAIIDHHKFNLNLNLPIKIQALAVGSTATIVYLKFKQYGFTIQTDLAKLMLCAVVSDTVGLKSATTTEKDRQAVTDLSQISGLTNLDELTLEIFKAKSNLSSLTSEQIIKNDYKVFDFKVKTYIGQIETVEPEVLLHQRKAELLTAMDQVKVQEGVSLLYLAVSDILKVNTKLLILGDAEKTPAELAFGGSVTDNVLDIGPKLSRKKEIAPALEKAING